MHIKENYLMNKKGKLIFIIAAVVLGSIAISVVDGIIKPEYVLKSAAKIAVFPLLPALYFLIFKDERQHLRSMFRPTKKALALAAALGVGVFTVVMSAFFLLRSFIDFSSFTNNLTSTAGISRENFIFVSAYICILNSFWEELFFRAFAFLSFKRHAGRKPAYVFSSLLFALYHTGMTAIWFAPWQFLIMLLGLFIGGIVFCFVDEKTESVFPSYLCHFFANLATTSIGFILLS